MQIIEEDWKCNEMTTMNTCRDEDHVLTAVFTSSDDWVSLLDGRPYNVKNYITKRYQIHDAKDMSSQRDVKN